MGFLTNIRDLCMDFLFPRSRKVLELEALSIDALIKILPPAEQLKDENSIALFDYSHSLVKEIIWELKYRGNTKIADKLGAILYDHILNELTDLHLFEKWNDIVLIPIPISDKRRSDRGWNQSELLTKSIMEIDNGKTFTYLPGQLVKTHHTESQTKTASRKERLKNLVNSMKVLHPPKIAGKYIVVIDDVTTTGSTFTEARRALHSAGAKKIFCVAVAH